MKRLRLSWLCLLVCEGSWGLSKGLVDVETLASRDGFTLSAQGRKIGNLELCGGTRWKGLEVAEGRGELGEWIEIRGIDTSGTGGTPVFSQDSRVRITLLEDEPYPRVDLDLRLLSFDPEAWREALKPDAPVYFLKMSLPNAKLHYQGGGLIPDPSWQEYPLSMKGFMAGDWSDGWSYAPPLSAWAVPAVGLWDSDRGVFVGYDFNHPRHTDRSCKYLAAATCAGNGNHSGKFVCLVHPYQREYVHLTYPEGPAEISTHFDLLYSFDMPSTKDPNMFVLRRLYKRYGDLLPAVPKMNDLTWIHREDAWSPPLGLPRTKAGSRLIWLSGKSGLAGHFLELGTTMIGNPFISDGVQDLFTLQDEERLQLLRRDLERLSEEAVWFTLSGEKCVSWNLPLAGKFKDQWGGEKAEGLHHCKTWHVGTAFLLMYEREKNPDYLPYIDGVYNFTKHFLYTRNGVCDLPWAMFCRVATAAGENFLLNYRRIFQEDPLRGGNREEALELATMCLYKVLWFYTTDPDETDEMDPTFLNQAVNDIRWAGRVTWNECGWVVRTMIPIYCETGDPFLKYLLRGSLDRYWMGFREDGGVAENLQISGDLEPKGLRTAGFAGIQHGACARRYACPIGEAPIRVVTGEKDAIAFCKETRDFDVDDYLYEEGRGFRFKLITLRPDKDHDPIDIVISAPFRDLRGMKVSVNGTEKNCEVNLATGGEDVYVKGVRVGDLIQVAASGPTTESDETRSQTPDLRPVRKFAEEGLARIDLAPLANRGLERRWKRKENWFGYLPGEHVVYGIPFWLVDPEENHDRCVVEGDGQHAIVIPVGMETKSIFLFFGLRREESEEGQSAAKFRTTYEDGSAEVVEAKPTILADITGFMPLRDWDLVMFQWKSKIESAVREISLIDGTLFAMTVATQAAPLERTTLPGKVLAKQETERKRRAAWKEKLSVGTALEFSAEYGDVNDYAHTYLSFVDEPNLIGIPDSSYLEYDFFIPLGNAGFSGAIDLMGGTLKALRDRRVGDALASSHPSATIKAAKGAWCHRKIDLSPVAGETFQYAVVAVDGYVHRSGTYRAWYKDVRLSDGKGKTLVDLCVNCDSVPNERPEILIEKGMTGGSVHVVQASDCMNPDAELRRKAELKISQDILNQDPSFERKDTYWALSSDGGAWYEDDSHSGATCVDLSIAEGGLAVVSTNVASSLMMKIKPNAVYAVYFWAKAAPPGAEVMLNFYDGRPYDFEQIKVQVEGDDAWHRYEVDVPTGKFPDWERKGNVFGLMPAVLPGLRLWTLEKPQVVYIDDVWVASQ